MPGLDDVHREVILRHYREPQNRGVLPIPPAVGVDGYNPMCGDQVSVYVELGSGAISDICIEGMGCSISQSSASMMSEVVKGRSVGETKALAAAFLAWLSVEEGEEPGEPAVDLGILVALAAVIKFPIRVRCATLGWRSLLFALGEPIESLDLQGAQLSLIPSTQQGPPR